ncbi:MAG: glyoxalase [Rhizobiales bacterium 65-9]|nr:VOC family protein [Hyphomicrobiales bacterium]OJY33219.1 MAG: glyoxalase [Rhizobiales bacterium 65-9]
MFSHIVIGSDDLDRSKAFYDALLPLLGLSCIADERSQGLFGYAADPQATPQFWIMKPINGAAASVGNGGTVAINAPNRALVDAFHRTALAQGATDEGAPGLRPHYHPDYYGAYLRDPDGHKICIVCHLPE